MNLKDFFFKHLTKQAVNQTLTLVLKETTVLQVVLDDDISDGVKHKLHVIRVCGAREMGVDLFRFFLFVQILKL